MFKESEAIFLLVVGGLPNSVTLKQATRLATSNRSTFFKEMLPIFLMRLAQVLLGLRSFVKSSNLVPLIGHGLP